MSQKRSLMLPVVDENTSPEIRWFSADGCVVEREDECAVYVGGTLIGTYTAEAPGPRNLILISLAANRRIRKGKLAQAFGITDERLRQIRREVCPPPFTKRVERREGARRCLPRGRALSPLSAKESRKRERKGSEPDEA